ncbi:hypothetical protein BC834DRAFT_971259 [Gloeopeniophorella convolvens]|nr:hypothetical protein BC834DRAFT_971259 [Gloeopeniophorella convolvens]
MGANCANSQFLDIGPYTHLFTHFRYFLSLRSEEGKYHSLILFRLSESNDTAVPPDTREDNVNQLYAMESACPHLGADLSHADIEEYDGSAVAVCPWHGYDSDLETGESITGLKACTYKVEVRSDADGSPGNVWLETSEEGRGRRLVELRPVSEGAVAVPPLYANSNTSPGFPDPSPVAVPDISKLSLLSQEAEEEAMWAVLILNTANLTLKVERTRHAVQLFRTGPLSSIGSKATHAPSPPDVPPRDDIYKKSIVDPVKANKRKNRVGMLHALANIEQWAIDLAWDIMVRFGPTHPDLPPAFFSDFTKMALDEAKHFSLLTGRLPTLGTTYGSLPVHAALWDSARASAHSLRSRLALIYLVHGACGLDVNPATIARFERAGDAESVGALKIIHADEVTHVMTGLGGSRGSAAGRACSCVPRGGGKGWHGEVKGPFNVEGRAKAGLTPAFYDDLRGGTLVEDDAAPAQALQAERGSRDGRCCGENGIVRLARELNEVKSGVACKTTENDHVDAGLISRASG